MPWFDKVKEEAALGDTYMVEFLQTRKNGSPDIVIDRGVSRSRDFETIKSNVFVTFRGAQAPQWGGPMIEAFRILDDENNVLLRWDLSDEELFQDEEYRRRMEMKKKIRRDFGLEDAM
ncbi:MAG: hypothetical protein ACLQIQ_16245 [Beijerinckiaceae bacterium]